jgi:hypothetical protein
MASPYRIFPAHIRHGMHRAKSAVNCVFSALVALGSPFYLPILASKMGTPMKKIAFGTAVILALLSVAGCANTGKGKAPPPVVTKG